MTSLTIFDSKGSEVGTIDVDTTRLAARINKQLLHDAVVMYRANARLGSNKTKSRSEVSGTTSKMYRQKGTGNARAGSRRSGVRRGGGHILSIQPRDYSYRMPKKAIRTATRMAIASKILDNETVVIDELAFDQPQTRNMAAVVKALGLDGITTLVVTETHDVNVYKSARNIVGVTVSPVAELNALAILSPRRMLVTKAALEAIQAKAEGRETEAAEATT